MKVAEWKARLRQFFILHFPFSILHLHSAPAPMMSAARGAPETNLQNPTNAPETFPLNSVARGAPQTFPPRLAAQRSANAQDVSRWKLRGAYDDAIRIPADVYHDGFAIFLRKESS